MKQTLDMDYFGQNLKIYKNCLYHRNQRKIPVEIEILIRRSRLELTISLVKVGFLIFEKKKTFVQIELSPKIAKYSRGF